ncbi:O-antigen ligase family protein [Terriglobus aquaticus]|uniref:O-antigen ligase family protein n=1 Tax=Terriglobus aquaticus TaxID=940139 RepID=A0ABW9KIK1_9BACT|nr:O-antigen ligase family protein [Terriglobus aquaticus]
MGTGLGHYIPIVAYLGFWIMCIVSLTGRPVLGMYYVMPFLPYRTMRFHFEDYPLASQTVTLLVVCVILGAFFKGKRLPPSALYPVWILFVVYLYVSMWLGGIMGNAPLPLWLNDANLVTWKDYLILPMVLFAASMVLEDRKQIRTALIVVAISTALVDRSALLESLSHSWAVFDENKRTSGPIAYGPNQLAAFLTQFAMFFWAFARVLKRFKTKFWFYVLTGFTLITMLYAFSRAAYIATLVAIGALALLKDRKLLVVLVVFLVTWQTVVPTAVSERVNMTHDANGQLEASAQERVDLWTQSRDMFMKNPVTGIGFGSFQFGEHTDNLKDTHNYYVKVLVETGLIGFLIFAAMLFIMFSASWKLFRTAKLAKDPLYEALGLGMLLLLTSALVLNGFGDRWSYVEINGLMWVVMGATLRAQVLVNELNGAPSGQRKKLGPPRKFATAVPGPPRLVPQTR